METRASNKTTHPGTAVKAKARRTSAEVQKERTAKARAKEAREDARQNSINRMAEFELADIAEEDLANATPRPPFTPKQWPAPRNQTYSDLTPLAATSDADANMSDDFDRASFVPPRSEMSVTADDSDVESDAPSPPLKKQKTQNIGKAAVKTAATIAAKKGGGKKQVDEPDVEVAPSNAELLQVPKGKGKKKMVRDEINIAAKMLKVILHIY
jgi:hypothetical protein